jgi:hypothetical protein
MGWLLRNVVSGDFTGAAGFFLARISTGEGPES